MCRADSASLSVGDGSAATLSVAASGLAVFVWLAYWLARVGFSTALLGSSVTTLGVSLFVLNSPAVADLLAGRTNVRSTEWYASPSASILFALVVCQLAGFAPSVWAGFFGIVLAVLGFALFALNAANLVRFPILQWSLSAGLGYVLMLVTLTVGMWGMGYQSPVFVEGLATGAVHQDTLFHADVCAMIGTLGYPTTGVDGAPVLHYHAGSNYLMSAMSRLTGLPPVEVYQLGFQVLIPPLLVAALLLVGFRLASVLKLPKFDHRILARSPWPWLVVAVVLGGVALPFDGGRNLLWLLPWTQMSESHGVGVALMFLWADLLLQVPGVLRKASMRAVMLLLFVVVPLMAAWMGYAKSSVLSVALPVVVYAVMRLRGYRDWRVLVSVILSGGAALATMMAMASTASRYPIDFGSLLKMMVSRTPFSASLAILGFIAGHYLLTLAYVWLRVRMQRDDAGRRGTLDLEVVILAVVIGTLPGVLLAIPGMSALYFSMIQRYTAGAMVLACVLAVSAHPRGSTDWQMLVAKVAVVLAVIATVVTLGRTAVGYDLGVREALRPAPVGSSDMRARFSAAVGQLDDLQAQLAQDPDWQTIQTLRGLRTRSDLERQSSILYITRENRFWSLIGHDYVDFAGPALAAMPMVGGLPDTGIPSDGGYGFCSYEPRDDSFGSQQADLSDVSMSAKLLGFRTLVVLTPDGSVISVPTGSSVP